VSVIVLRDADGTWRADERDAYDAAMLAGQTGVARTEARGFKK
jgi:hypothetical protein